MSSLREKAMSLDEQTTLRVGGADKIMDLVKLADRELQRLDADELRLMPSIQRLKEILEDKRRILEAQLATMEHLKRLVELSEAELATRQERSP